MRKFSCILYFYNQGAVKRTKGGVYARNFEIYKPVTFYLDIYFKRVELWIELLVAYKALIGARHPNHLFSVEGLPKEDIQATLDQYYK